MAKKKEKDSIQPRVHPDLKGFRVEVNSFGEVRTVYDLDELNLFLNKNVKDKKFRGRDDIEGVPDEFKEEAQPEDKVPLPAAGSEDEPYNAIHDEAELPPNLPKGDEDDTTLEDVREVE